MTTSKLDRLVEEVKTLTSDEQRNLRDIVDELLAKSKPQMTEEEFEQHLLKKASLAGFLLASGMRASTRTAS